MVYLDYNVSSGPFFELLEMDLCNVLCYTVQYSMVQYGRVQISMLELKLQVKGDLR